MCGTPTPRGTARVAAAAGCAPIRWASTQQRGVRAQPLDSTSALTQSRVFHAENSGIARKCGLCDTLVPHRRVRRSSLASSLGLAAQLTSHQGRNHNNNAPPAPLRPAARPDPEVWPQCLPPVLPAIRTGHWVREVSLSGWAPMAARAAPRRQLRPGSGQLRAEQRAPNRTSRQLARWDACHARLRDESAGGPVGTRAGCEAVEGKNERPAAVGW